MDATHLGTVAITHRTPSKTPRVPRLDESPKVTRVVEDVPRVVKKVVEEVPRVVETVTTVVEEAPRVVERVTSVVDATNLGTVAISHRTPRPPRLEESPQVPTAVTSCLDKLEKHAASLHADLIASLHAGTPRPVSPISAREHGPRISPIRVRDQSPTIWSTSVREQGQTISPIRVCEQC